MEIKPLPDIPELLRNSSQMGNLVLFVGAGVSRIAGCPGWIKMADMALGQMVAANGLSHAEVEQLDRYTPRVKIAVAERAAKDRGLAIDYKRIFEPNGRFEPVGKGRRVYAALGGISNRFVTTNYDRWLDFNLVHLDGSEGIPDKGGTEAFGEPRKVLINPKEFSAVDFEEPNTVMHLHGSVSKPSSMILTTRDYLRHYANDRGALEAGGENCVLSFLEYLFNAKVVLFVGYGLEELEILEYVVQKTHSASPDGSEVKHFMLQGFFSFQKDLAGQLQKYFRHECGIGMLPFQRDKENYDQLINVLEEFAVQIPSRDPAVLQKLANMETLYR
jgi:SIR2-like protein